MKKIFVLLVLLLVLLTPATVFADDNSDEYTIDGYDVEMVVSENNTFQITENIDAYFYIYKHGIFRTIPINNTIIREDGSKSSSRADITDITVNEMYEAYNEAGYKVIKIGDPNYTLIGEKSYEISYLYNIGKDRVSDKDEFYFNIIGSEWDTTIQNISFKIIMPKEFDESKLGFSVGYEGSSGYDDNLTYTVQENVITGTYMGTLYPGDALTIRMELPEDYFVGESSNFNWGSIISIILGVVFVLISFILWLLLGRDKPVIETVEFYPPNGYNSARVGFIYNGKSQNEDVVSLIVYLANKGYIEIEEEGKKFVFRKLKEYDGENQEESIFMEGLFKNRTEVREADLKNTFYLTVAKVIDTINNKDSREAIFESKFPIKRGIVAIMMIVLTILITARPALDYFGDDIMSMVLGIVLPLIGIFWIFAGLFDRRKSVGGKLFGIIGGTLFIIVPFFVLMWYPLLQDPSYMIAYLVGIVCLIIMSLFYYILPKRTQFGNEMLGKIAGFKNFLELVEKPKLEAMVMENPSYFYDILPFTYVLGLSDKWIEKFENITIQPPDWYRSNTTFNTIMFGHFMTSTMRSSSVAMASRPQSRSGGGGGFSGGGFSGGGLGGGGGGSW